MKRLAHLLGAAILTLVLSVPGFAQSLTMPDPVGASFSHERLGRIAPWYQSQIDMGALPGAVVAIARDGKASLASSPTCRRSGPTTVAERSR